MQEHSDIKRQKQKQKILKRENPHRERITGSYTGQDVTGEEHGMTDQNSSGVCERRRDRDKGNHMHGVGGAN